VRCAVEVQLEMIARNAVAPAGRRIEFRVGINVGDIIIENGDIFGDGVNIAARLEAAGGAGRDLPQRRGARAMPRPPISRALNRNWLKNRTFFNEFGPRNHLSLDRRENQPLAAQSPFKNMCDNNCLDKLAAWGKGPFSVGMPKT
jgi:hypothetical protein